MPDSPKPEPRLPRFRLPRRARTPWQAPRARTLFTRPAASPQRMLLHRVYLVVGLCVLAFAVLYLDRDGLRDANRKVLGIVDLMYFTMVTVATVGYGDIVPVTARARLIDAFLSCRSASSSGSCFSAPPISSSFNASSRNSA